MHVLTWLCTYFQMYSLLHFIYIRYDGQSYNLAHCSTLWWGLCCSSHKLHVLTAWLLEAVLWVAQITICGYLMKTWGTVYSLALQGWLRISQQLEGNYAAKCGGRNEVPLTNLNGFIERCISLSIMWSHIHAHLMSNTMYMELDNQAAHNWLAQKQAHVPWWLKPHYWYAHQPDAFCQLLKQQMFKMSKQ